MAELGYLFSNKNSYIVDNEWESTKELVEESIDVALSRGNVDRETLLIMKELLKSYKPTMNNYVGDL